MTTLTRTTHRIARTALGGAFVLSLVSVLYVATTAWCQQPSPAPTPGAPAAKRATPGQEGIRDDHDAAQDRNGLEVLEAQLEAKRALVHIDESRAEQSKRWRDYYERMVRDGRVMEDRMIAARDDVLMMDAQVATECAELKVAEIHVRYARGHAAQGDQAASEADQAREQLDELETLLEAKQNLLRLAESRAKQARRTEAHLQSEFRGGMATEDRVLAARDDVLLIDSILAWGRVDLKVAEIRLKNARQFASHGRPAKDSVSRRLAELEERLASAEMKADVLQHEVGRLRRELPRETHGAR